MENKLTFTPSRTTEFQKLSESEKDIFNAYVSARLKEYEMLNLKQEFITHIEDCAMLFISLLPKAMKDTQEIEDRLLDIEELDSIKIGLENKLKNLHNKGSLIETPRDIRRKLRNKKKYNSIF